MADSHVVAKGFLKKRNNRIRVNWRTTLSIIQNEILLDLLVSHSNFISRRLLDLGCGARPYELIYSDKVERAVGADIPSSVHKIDVDIYAHGESLPFRDNSFDTVLCTEVLEHTLDVEQAVDEINRVLDVDGILIMSVPFAYPVHEPPFDFLRFTVYGVSNLLDRHNFEIVSLKSKGGVVTAFLCLLQYVVIGTVHQILKKLRLSSLMDYPIVRFLFVFHQYVYWGIFGMFFRQKLRRRACDVSKYESLLSIGYFCVAKKKAGQRRGRIATN